MLSDGNGATRPDHKTARKAWYDWRRAEKEMARLRTYAKLSHGMKHDMDRHARDSVQSYKILEQYFGAPHESV